MNFIDIEPEACYSNFYCDINGKDFAIEMVQQNQNDNLMKILNYWYTMEFLSQGNFPKEEKNKEHVNSKSMVKVCRALTTQDMSKSLYEIISQEASKCTMKSWGNLTFYIGKISRAQCIEKIEDVLPFESEQEKSPEKDPSEIACASLQLSPNGLYVRHSLSLSPILWSISQIHQSKQNISDIINEQSYKKDVDELENEYFHSTQTSDNNTIPPEQQIQSMQTFSDYAVTATDLQNLLRGIEKKYIKETPDGFGFQTIYLIDFYLFADEKTKEQKEKNMYLGLSHDYYTDDIKFIIDQINDNFIDQTNMGRELTKYIMAGLPSKNLNRFDLVRKPSEEEKNAYLRTLIQILDVSKAPMGKWPSQHMPSLMQQIAINCSIGKTNEGSSPIFSINGPPGTGKTTLLKEIVVSNLVDRAYLLSQYEHPSDAFEKHRFVGGEKENSQYDKYLPYWYSLKNDQINNYGILVASNNNAAVENITKELPVNIADGMSDNELDSLNQVIGLFDPEVFGTEEFSDKGDSFKDIYFTKYAQDLMGGEDLKIWGLIAAPLGKGSNLNNFYWKVLYPLQKDYYKNESIKNRLVKYQTARTEFLNQYEIVRQLQAQLRVPQIHLEQEVSCKEELERAATYQKDKAKEHKQAILNSQTELEELRKCQHQYRDTIANKQASAEELEGEIQEYQNSISQKTAEINLYEQYILTSRKSMHWWTKLFHKEVYLTAERNLDLYNKQINDIQMQIQSLSQMVTDKNETKQQLLDSAQFDNAELEKIEESIQKQEAVIQAHQNQQKQEEKDYEAAEINYQKACSVYEQDIQKAKGKQTFLGYDFLDNLYSDDNTRSTQTQVSNPWFTETYNREREKLVAYAIRLNREFILSSKECRNNLKILSLYWEMDTNNEGERVVFKEKDKEKMMPALFQTLFLLVPVISTTFASAGNMFKDIKKSESLGLLVVDEAGQAQPQCALGILYRCRKAVIVGDPNQIQPVVSDDLRLLRKAFNEEVLRPYHDSTISVQSFVDQLNHYGTYIDNGSDFPEWIGCPLLVHRRCIDPMYEISNELSYNNIMKQQTSQPTKEKEDKFIYSASQWINVCGRENGHKDHFVVEQGKKVCELLDIAFSKQDKPDIYIISPFTTVANGIYEYIQKNWNTSKQNKDYMLDCEHKRIGTVHTFQGREAEEVIFLLGCDKESDSLGAIKWVKKNIVNVAVTRAKYRLYIIGDAQAWSHSGCISLAKQIIDTYAINRIQDISDSDLPEEERNIAFRQALTELPPASSFTEEIVQEDGSYEYHLETWGLRNGLSRDFLNIPLTTEQLEEFGFSSQHDIDQFPADVKENMRLGMKLYFLFRPLFDLDPSLDASCCAILFCKSLELQMIDCFYEAFKNILPEFTIRGEGPDRTAIPLGEARKNEITLGTIVFILKDERNREILADRTQIDGSLQYSAQWWMSFMRKLNKSTSYRNKCCHPHLFDWRDQTKLLDKMFRGDDESQNTEIPIGGLMSESQTVTFILNA